MSPTQAPTREIVKPVIVLIAAFGRSAERARN
jgi:hypothetical protein